MLFITTLAVASILSCFFIICFYVFTAHSVFFIFIAVDIFLEN